MSTTLPPLPDHPEREAFEEWIERELNYGYNLTRDAEGNYPHDATDTAWLAWQGRAALAEAAQSLPDGWKPVPVEPTEAMMKAAHKLPDILDVGDEYRAMIAASPAQPVQEARQPFDEAAERSGAERGYELRVRRVSERNEHEKMMYALGWWDRAWLYTTHQAEQPVQPSETQWQKRHPLRTEGNWENTNEHDAKWWRDNSQGWEIRVLYALPPAPQPKD